MKKTIKIFAVLALVAIFMLDSCKKSSDTTPQLSLVSLLAGSTDLNGVTAATGLDTVITIKALFNTQVTATSATTSNIKLSATTNTTVDVPDSVKISGDTLIIKPRANLILGTVYTLTLSNLSSGTGVSFSLTTTFTTKGVGFSTVPEPDKLLAYVQFNGNIKDLAGNLTQGFTQCSYATDRFGNANSCLSLGGMASNGQGDIVDLENADKVITKSTTISFWLYVDVINYHGTGGSGRTCLGLAGYNGFAFDFSDSLIGLKSVTDHVNSAGGYGAEWGDTWDNGTKGVNGRLVDYAPYTKLDKKWANIVLTYDASTTIKTVYCNGVAVFQRTLSADSWSTTLGDFALFKDAGVVSTIGIGYSGGSKCDNPSWWAYYNKSTKEYATNTFKGLIDDFRIWSVPLSSTEVAALYTAEKP